MASVVFCGHCCTEKGWDRVKPPVRVTDDPCDFCGGHDVIRKRTWHPRTGQPNVKVINMKNFIHDDQFLPGMRAETRLQNPLT